MDQNHQFNFTRIGQFPDPTNPGTMYSSIPVHLHQTSSINVFMMGRGQGTVNLGYYPVSGQNVAEPEIPWTMTPYQNNPGSLGMGMAMASPYGEQERQKEILIGPTATGSTFPQSGYIQDLGELRKSDSPTKIEKKKNGGAGNGSAVGENNGGRRVTRSKAKGVTFSDQPSVMHSPTNGNSPQSGGSSGSANGND